MTWRQTEKHFGPFAFVRQEWPADALAGSRVTYQLMVRLTARVSVQLLVLRFDEP